MGLAYVLGIHGCVCECVHVQMPIYLTIFLMQLRGYFCKIHQMQPCDGLFPMCSYIAICILI